MSLIKAIKAQLGLSVTPANNFTLDASADNGTMKLARNSGQDIMTVAADGKVAFPQMVQSWQDLTSTRATGVTYTNSTGQPIEIAVNVSGPARIDIVIGSNVLYGPSGAAGANLQMGATIPAGANYSVTAFGGNAPALSSWHELRN
jgi:hypothetical protein